MTLLIVSFLAGVLTVAAPCILPLLPVIVGGSITPDGKTKPDGWKKPLTITGSLALSVVAFSLMLKATTALLGVSTMVWQVISATIVVLLGLNYILPTMWERLALKIGLANGPNKLLAATSSQKGTVRDVLIGASLGPIFTSCSPTYALIVASILPTTFARGLAYLLAYAVGLSVMLLLIALLGRAFVSKLGWIADPKGGFRKIIGILFILVGLMVLSGVDKKIQTFVIDKGWYAPVAELEERLRK